MLELLRKKAQSPYIQATILIIAVVFIFWGVGSNRRGGGDAIATVNGDSITIGEFQRTYDQTIDQYRQQFGGSLPPNLVETLGLKRQVLNKLIERRLLLQAAADMGVLASDKEVRQTIESIASFRTNGAFDLQRYKEVLAASRMTSGNFEASIRSDLLTDKTIELLSHFVQVTPTELENRFAYEYGSIVLDYAAFEAKDFRDRVSVEEEALAAYFEANKKTYQTAPQVKLQYITFEPDGGAAVTDEAVRNYYAEHLSDFQIPEQRRARHILIKVAPDASEEIRANKRQQAETILAMARQGQDFATLAKKYSEDGSAVQGGDLGLVSRGQMIPAFEQAVFALKEGAISDVVKTEFGYHLIKVEEIRPARTEPLAEARNRIVARLKAAQGKNEAFEKANDTYEKIIMAGSLANYAKANEAAVRTTDFFPRNRPPAELIGNKALLDTAFGLKQGELSSLIETEAGYAIAYVEAIKAPEIPPLAEVRPQVEADFRADRAKELAREAADKMLKGVKEGAGFAEEAKELGGGVATTPAFSRGDQAAAGLPAPVIRQGFTLTAERPLADEVVAADSTFYVLRLKERQPPPASLLAEKRDELRRRLLSEERMTLLAAWMENLSNRAEITINEKML